MIARLRRLVDELLAEGWTADDIAHELYEASVDVVGDDDG